MKKAIHILESIYHGVLVLLTASIIILGIYQVLGRNLTFVELPISWTEEAMRYLYVGIIMLGLACVTRDESFTTITIISEFVERKTKLGGTLLYLFKQLMQLACFLLLFWYGLNLALSAGNRVAATTRIPFNIIYAPIPIGAFFSCIFTVLKVIERFRSNNKKEVAADG